MDVIGFAARVLPFAVVMSFTPGPNNLMLASAGSRFGFVRTIPHQLGVLIGFAIMMACVALGIASLIAAVPSLYLVMKVASVAYMLHLAWRIARAEGGGGPLSPSAGPIGFATAVAFQWINPKAWIQTLTAAGSYTNPSDPLGLQVALLTLLFAVVGVASITTWVMFGQIIRRYLTSPRRRTIFNRTMAVLLVASVVPVIFEGNAPSTSSSRQDEKVGDNGR